MDTIIYEIGFPGDVSGNEPTCQCRRWRFHSGSGRSPGGGNGKPSILACRIPWTEEPGRLQSIGSQRDKSEAT